NVSSCVASGSWSGNKATSGTQSTGAVTTTSSYSLTCAGTGGSVSQTATVTVVPAPTLTLTASPGSVASGAASTLTWNSTNATTCVASGTWSGNKASSGTQSTGPLPATSTFMLHCTGVGGSTLTPATVT